MAQIREGLIGLPGTRLASCLPTPADVQIEGEREQLTYRWFPEGPEAPITQREPPIRTTNPQVGGYPDRRAERGSFGQPALCELYVELEDGIIVDVTSHGRTADGLSADSRCLYEVRHCAS